MPEWDPRSRGRQAHSQRNGSHSLSAGVSKSKCFENMPPGAEIFTQEKQAIEGPKTGPTSGRSNLSAVLHRATDSGADFQALPLKTIKAAGVMKNEITITKRAVAISQHASGVICAYDSRHRILKVRLQGGAIAELVQERTANDTICGEYRNQLLTVINGRDASVIEF